MSHLDTLRAASFSLGGLAAHATSLCARLRVHPGDERVRIAPDERTLRYYQSVGLLDRPLRYDGRVAIYGYRHLVQAVAVKALQGEGLSLAQIQAALAGISTERLEAAVAQAIGEQAMPGAEATSAAEDFAAATPALAPDPGAVVAREAAPAGLVGRALVTFELAPGVWLTIDPNLNPEPAEVAAALVPHLPRSAR